MTFPPATAIRLPAQPGSSERDGSSITLSTHELGDGPAVLFCHGFPDLALGWRHQLEPVGLIHLYARRSDGVLLGAEMFGPRVEHMAHLLAWAIQARLTVDQALAMPIYRPVVEEGLRTALRELAWVRAQ